jgi:glycosyltransferase involved in cell wall biosynthesis
MRGITKIRNEEGIIGDTLDRWYEICEGGIHVYSDCSTDNTVDICKKHPAVVEVITSDFYDPDRERAEWYNRNALLNSARRFMENGEWVVYFDGDEHPYNVDLSKLTGDACSLALYDVYITPEDVGKTYEDRLWVGPEKRDIPFFFRLRPWSNYHVPDQRIMAHMGESPVIGRCKHFGKGFSVEQWEQKCDYYSTTFGPKYAKKWAKRRGKAVHTLSDFGNELIKF